MANLHKFVFNAIILPNAFGKKQSVAGFNARVFKRTQEAQTLLGKYLTMGFILNHNFPYTTWLARIVNNGNLSGDDSGAGITSVGSQITLSETNNDRAGIKRWCEQETNHCYCKITNCGW